MECQNCGHSNLSEAKFCSRCGTALERQCSVCSFALEPDARFCSNCGTPVVAADGASEDLARYLPDELLTKMRSARAGRAMQGERRTVTMLFADITGSTAAAESMDPEDWAEIANGAFEHLIAPVYRYEGTLARLAGDAVLAFFGAPIAHEDDPLRAMRAGLAIVEGFEGYRDEIARRWGIEIEVRVGINTGLVVVGEVGSDLRVEYTALGDAINVAARMEQTAEAGTVRVTGQTRGLATDAFEFEEIGPVQVKGKSDPVPAFRVLRFAATSADVGFRPIVGRTAERTKLDELRGRLAAGGGWIASIVGEAGIGKSRLLHDLRLRAEGATPLAVGFRDRGEANWMAGIGRSYESSTPYGTIGDLLRRWWGTEGADDPFRRVTEAIEAAGLSDLPDAAALLSHLGGIPLPDEARTFIDALETPALHSKVGEALESYVTAVARSRPTFFVLEDLHWADDLTLAVVDQIMDLTERTALGVVLAMRPYREEPTWRIHQVAERDHPHRYHPMFLSQLAGTEGLALLESLTRDIDLPQETKERILARSDGNPLYIEEMVGSLRETGTDVSDELIPTSVSAILTARLDRLDDTSKYAAQLASVLGTEFHRDTLAALAPEVGENGHVTELLRRGFLVEAEAGRLAFRHALMQEAAYGTILRRTRRELHRRVADYLAVAHPDAPQETARHLIEAGEPSAAFPHLVEAGVRATRSMALADAIRHLSMAIENPPDDADPDDIVRAHNALGEAYSLVPDLPGAAAAYQRLYDYGEQSHRPAARVAALNRLGFAMATIGADLDKATEYLETARTLAEDAGDELGMAEYHMNSCFVASLNGQVEKAVLHDEETVNIGEKSGDLPIRLTGLVRRAANYLSLLDIEQGAPAVESARAAAEEAGAEEAGAVVEAMGSGHLRWITGDLRGALEHSERAAPVLERYASFYQAINQNLIGGYLYELGDPEGALSRFTETRRVSDKLGQSFVASTSRAGMALVYATVGVDEPIASLRDEAIRLLDGPLGGFLANTTWAHLGHAALMQDDPATADHDFGLGLEASSINQFLERPRLLGGRALAVLRQGRVDLARRNFEEAVAFAHQKRVTLFDPFLSLVESEILMAENPGPEIDAVLARGLQTAMDSGRRLLSLQFIRQRALLARSLGDSSTDARHVEAAEEIIRTIASSIADEALRGSFASHWHASLTTEAPID